MRHLAIALIMVFPYYGSMNITLSVDDELVKEVRKIAVERDTTLTGLVRDGTLKREEWNAYARHLSPWERETTLDV